MKISKIDNPNLAETYNGLSVEAAKQWLEKIASAKGKEKKDDLLAFKQRFGANYNEANIKKLVAEEEAKQVTSVDNQGPDTEPAVILNTVATQTISNLNNLAAATKTDEDNSAAGISNPAFKAAASVLDNSTTQVLTAAQQQIIGVAGTGLDTVLGQTNVDTGTDEYDKMNLHPDTKEFLRDLDKIINSNSKELSILSEKLKDTSLSDTEKDGIKEKMENLLKTQMETIEHKNKIIEDNNKSPEPAPEPAVAAVTEAPMVINGMDISKLNLNDKDKTRLIKLVGIIMLNEEVLESFNAKLIEPSLSITEKKEIEDKKEYLERENLNIKEKANKIVESNGYKPDNTIDNKDKKDLNSREMLEILKIKEGKIDEEQAKFRNTEFAKNTLDEDLNEYLKYFLHTPNKRNKEATEFMKNVMVKMAENMAQKTGLSVKEIQEIMKSNEQSMVDSARAEINAETSKFKKWSKVGTRILLYTGAGVGMSVAVGLPAVAALGITGLYGASAIALARTTDRYLSGKMDENKISRKVADIKNRKESNPDELEKLKNRFATSVSIRKQLEIERINLGSDEASQDKVIKDFIAENLPPEISPEDMPFYQEDMLRTLKGLDAIDKLNADKEEKLNKSGWFEKLKKGEGKIFGEGKETKAGEKAVTTAVVAGMALAAREIPVLREVLFAYTGWRLGGALGDYVINRADKSWHKNDYFNDWDRYEDARAKLLDQSFLKNNPEEYARLKGEVQNFEVNKAAQASEEIEELNSDFEEKLKNDKTISNINKYSKTVLRLLGATLGLMGGSLLNDLAAERLQKMHQGEHGATNSKLDIANKKLHVEKNLDKENSGDITSDSTKTVTSASGNSTSGGKGIEHLTQTKQGAAQGSTENMKFSDKISNEGLNRKSDSVWRSTREIFKNNAAKLGYKGDANDHAAIYKWAESQTAKAIHNTSELKDKVFEGNRVFLEDDGNHHYHVSVEKGEGAAPKISHDLDSNNHQGHHPDSNHHQHGKIEKISKVANPDGSMKPENPEEIATVKLVQKYGLSPEKCLYGGAEGVFKTTIDNHEIYIDTNKSMAFWGRLDGPRGDIDLSGKESITTVLQRVSNAWGEYENLAKQCGFSLTAENYISNGMRTTLSGHEIFIDLHHHTVDYSWNGKDYSLNFAASEHAKIDLESQFAEQLKLEHAAEGIQDDLVHNQVKNFTNLKQALEGLTDKKLSTEQKHEWHELFRSLSHKSTALFDEAAKLKAVQESMNKLLADKML